MKSLKNLKVVLFVCFALTAIYLFGAVPANQKTKAMSFLPKTENAKNIDEGDVLIKSMSGEFILKHPWAGMRGYGLAHIGVFTSNADGKGMPLVIEQNDYNAVKSVHTVSFDFILKSDPNHKGLNTNHEKDKVKVNLTASDEYQYRTKYEDIKKSKMLPELAKLASEVTKMDCHVFREYIVRGRFVDVICIWEDKNKVLPMVRLNILVSKYVKDFTKENAIFPSYRILKFKTISKKHGVNIEFSIPMDNHEQWQEVYPQILKIVDSLEIKTQK